MHIIELKDGEDSETLKFKIASDPVILSNLALLADRLGFGWCGGSGSHVGGNFDVTKSGDGYVLQAHYDPAVQEGFWDDKRLRITLSNFRVAVDAGTLQYGTPEVRDRKPIAVHSVTVTNPSADSEDEHTTTFHYETSTTITHEVSASLTAGVTISITGRAEIPKVAELEQTNEFSFSSTIGWARSEEKTTGQALDEAVTSHLPPRTRRTLTLVATQIRSDVTYTAEAAVDFDVELYGFLRYSGNARSGHPTDRPFVTAKFEGGLSRILDLYDHRDIPNYSEWDWNWIKERELLERVIGWMREKIGVRLEGKFESVSGVDVHVNSGEVERLTDATAAAVPGGALLNNASGAAQPAVDAPVRVISVVDEQPES